MERLTTGSRTGYKIKDFQRLQLWRLYKIGFHLQISEQLLLGVTVDVLSDPVNDVEDEDQAAHLPMRGCASNLEAAQLDELKLLYRDIPMMINPSRM